MNRVSNAVPSLARKKKIFKAVKGFSGRRKNCLRVAKIAYKRKLLHEYIGRKHRKRNFRRLWILQINGFLRSLGEENTQGISYTDFCIFRKFFDNHLKTLNRKILANLMVLDTDNIKRQVIESIRNVVQRESEDENIQRLVKKYDRII